MKTHCNQKTFEFQAENSRKIVAHFNGGNISSDCGGLLLRQVEQITGIIRQFAGCFTDHRYTIDNFFTNVFLQSHHRPPSTIVLDLDATGSYAAMVKSVVLAQKVELS